jgi:hypothetical protein
MKVTISPEQLRQLRDLPARLILAEQLGGRAAAQLILEKRAPEGFLPSGAL